MSKTVTDYQLEIMNAQNEIAKLQSQCAHSDHDLVMFMWRPGAFNPTRICKQCNLPIPGITEEESKKLWDDFRGASQSHSFVTYTNTGESNE